jgi:hypothetical protein
MRVALIYNEPQKSDYGVVGEYNAVEAVLEAVDAVHEALLQLEFDVTVISRV